MEAPDIDSDKDIAIPGMPIGSERQPSLVSTQTRALLLISVLVAVAVGSLLFVLGSRQQLRNSTETKRAESRLLADQTAHQMSVMRTQSETLSIMSHLPNVDAAAMESIRDTLNNRIEDGDHVSLLTSTEADGLPTDCAQGCWRVTSATPGQEPVIEFTMRTPRAPGDIGGVRAQQTVAKLRGELQAWLKPGDAAWLYNRDTHRIEVHIDPRYENVTLDQLVRLSSPDEMARFKRMMDSGQAASWRAWSRRQNANVRYHVSPMAGTPWNLVLSSPERRVVASLLRAATIDIGMLVLGLGGMVLWLRRYLTRSLAPLQSLETAASRIATGDLDFHLEPSTDQTEIGRLTHAFSHMQDRLRRSVQDVADNVKQSERREGELDIARSIQRAMLPPPGLLADQADIDLTGFLLPQRYVSGDFYTYMHVNQHHLSFILGDVSDKGIPASLFMSRTMTLFSAAAPHVSDPANMLSRLNADLQRNNTAFMFVTAICGVLDMRSGELKLASAGHEYPLLHDPLHVRMLELATGPALGIDEDSHYETTTLQLAPGQAVMLYTDGITEATDRHQEMFGSERMLDVLQHQPVVGSENSVSALVQHVFTMVEGAPQSDDIALLDLRWTPHDRIRSHAAVATMESVFQALDWIEANASELGVPVDQAAMIRLVAEELLVNTHNYGYPDERIGRFALTLLRGVETVTLQIVDNAAPFDPTQSSEPDHERSVAERATGGEGIHLARKLARDMRYHPKRGGNVIELDFQLDDDVGHQEI